MRKYIHVARDIRPTLTREAADYIAEEYSKLRSQDSLQQDNVARVRGREKVIKGQQLFRNFASKSNGDNVPTNTVKAPVLAWKFSVHAFVLCSDCFG